MSYDDIKKIQTIIGGKLITDPYPYMTYDTKLWVDLLTRASYKGIGLYGALTYIRAIGAVLEPNAQFGYMIKPLLRNGHIRWGWNSVEQYNEAKNMLKPYTSTLLNILREMRKNV